LKNQIGPESGAARPLIYLSSGGEFVRMGRLIEPVSNGRARLMIEAMQMEQNPAYSFAAANTPLSATEGVFCFCPVLKKVD